MPLRGRGHPALVKDEAPYFTELAELDAWFAQPRDELRAVVPYQPRPGQEDAGRGKLLVCHDYKGGYHESPSGLCYTFNYWRLCDIFVYFSHYRVTVPPSGWTNAAHKQGARMLGTLIFEHLESEPDCLQLLVGCTDYDVVDNKIPISNRYAVLLAELAYQRGFDGYLLNFEWDLQYNTDMARALAAWILLLEAELRTKVGPHAQVMWYDSVIYDGQVRYRNRVDGYNLPFFLASDTFFTNYWWKPKTQEEMSEYFAKLVSLPTATTSLATGKTLQSIFSGIDVWGRGTYGDGGYCCYRAMTYTAPLSFSTALFAPGWSWEGATEEAEKNWDVWWNNDRKWWLGPLSGESVPEVPDCSEGPFKPIAAFFQDLPPPDPASFVFYTNFSPGVGYSWFVEGTMVLDTTDGWTDIDKQSSIGNLVWPCPTLSLERVQLSGPPQQYQVSITTSTAFDMTDGYNGGNTLKLTLTHSESGSDSVVETYWLPVQSLLLTTQTSFEACIVYKTTPDMSLDVDSRIHIKSGEATADLTLGKPIVTDLAWGWTQQIINFTCTSAEHISSVSVGFLITFKPKDDPTGLSTATGTRTGVLSLGQLAVYPTAPPPSVSTGMPSVTCAKFAPSDASTLEGVLTWDTASTFTPIDVGVDSADSTTPVWLLDDTPAYRFPNFAYFIVYGAPLDSAGNVTADVDPTFLGTTGLDGRANRFHVALACFPDGWEDCPGVRFYVRGVTDRGDVLPWERCASVDHKRIQSDTSVRADRFQRL